MADYPDYTDIMQIVGSDIMVPMDIQGSYIMIPMDIQGSMIQVPVDIQGSMIQVPVDIQAQYVTLEIDIVAQSVGNITIDIAAQSVGNIAINLAASDITLDVNLAASAVTLNVAIQSSAVTLDMNIKTSEITLNVDITAQTIANLNINVNAQAIGMHTEPEWEAKQGKDEVHWGTVASLGFAWELILSYTVTAGKTFYVTDVTAAFTDGEGSFALRLENATDNVILFYGSGSNTCIFAMGTPKAIPGGKLMRLYGRTTSATGRECSAVVAGYEV